MSCENRAKLIREVFVAILIAISSLTCGRNNPVDNGGAAGGKLVFVLTDTSVGPSGIYSMNVDGSKLKALAIPGDSVYFPGTWGIYYVIGDYFPLNYPRWSPDGSKIACQLSWTFDQPEIMIMNSDGTNKHVLWKIPSGAGRPEWSPKGDRLLFAKTGFIGEVFALGIIDTSGDNEISIPEVAYNGDEPQIFEEDSIWSYGTTSDFQWGASQDLLYAIGLVNKRPGKVSIAGSDPSNEIFAYDSKTGLIRNRITRNDIDEGHFLFSIVANRIGFQRGDYGGADNVIHLVSLADGSQLSIEFGATIKDWKWANDGRMIVYAKDEDPDRYNNSDWHIYVVSTNKPSSQKRLTTFNAGEPDLFIPAN